jgi:HK97 gp10 family phage protein
MAEPLSLKVTIDARKLNTLTNKVTDQCARKAAGITRDRARSNLVMAGRTNTGKLAASITTRKRASPAGRAIYDVGSPLSYARYQEEGTRGVPARPGQILRFKPKGSAVFIFRPRTKGIKGVHFLRNAYRSLTKQDFLP